MGKFHLKPQYKHFNNMRRINYILVILSALLICTHFSCKGKPDELFLNFTISSDELVFWPEASFKTVQVSSNAEFTASSDKSWCSVEIIPDREQNLKVTVEKYDQLNEERIAHILVESKREKKYILVRQTAVKSELTVKEEQVLVNENKELTFSLEINSNILIDFVLPDWIEMTSEKPKTKGKQICSFKATPLPFSQSEREGKIIVYAKDSITFKDQVIIPVRQYSAVELRVLTYNIHIGIDMDNKLNLEKTAKVIKDLNPDIVALQEVDRFTDRTNRIDQPEVLSELTGMYVVFGKTVDRSGGDYGIAILSRFPIESSEYTELPNTEPAKLEDRGALKVKLHLNEENRFSFICTHFCHESEARRILQARKINELFVSDDDEIIILGGDFNAAPSASSIATLKEKWFDSTSKEFTFPSPKPTVKIDYIFYRGNDALQVKETQVVPDLVTSDHRPVLTVFEWLQKK